MRKRFSLIQLSFLILIALSFAGCSKRQPTARQAVVVYTSLDKVFSQPILEEFEHKTGIKVKSVYDSEATKTTGLVNRLIAENILLGPMYSGIPRPAEPSS